ncbi:MAG: hypothetical protein PVG07_07845 [Acidobacteriota bacterium]|jgi:hypothetical protein
MTRPSALLSAVALSIALAAPLVAQTGRPDRVEPPGPSYRSSAISIGELQCLAVAENAPLRARVETESIPVGGVVRLYFRRLNPDGTFYWVEMLSDPDGSYWSVFPKPEDREQLALTDSWWEELKDRDWMEGHDREWLEDWLADQENEAAEYWVGVYDAAGKPVQVSETRLVRVFHDEDDGEDENGDGNDECPIVLTPREKGWAENLTVGETVPPQVGKQVYHWLCDGIVTRVDWQGVFRADSICRRCIVAWWDKPESLVPAAVLLGGGVTVGGGEISPSRPDA